MNKLNSRFAQQPEELWLLIGRICDGEATPMEVASLERQLQADPRALDLFVAYLSVHAELQWRQRGSSSACQNDVVASGPVRQGPSSPALGFLGRATQFSTSWLASPKVLALTVVGCLATYFLGLIISLAITRAYLGERDVADRHENSALSQARIIAADDARWQGTPPTGQLPSGVSRLATGTVEIEFDGGARVWIEGPAEFVPRSGQRVELNHGRLMAYVPRQARGFAVGTPTAELVDLGTEFGVDVDTAGKTDVHVLKGAVEVKPVASGLRNGTLQIRRVTAGQAVRVSGDGRNLSVVATEFAPRKFVRPAPPGTAKTSRNKSRSRAEAATGGDTKVPANFAEYGLEVHGFQDFFVGRDFEPGWIEVSKEQERPAGSTLSFTLRGDGALHVNATRLGGAANKLLYRPGSYAGDRQTVLAMIKVLEPLGMMSDGWRGGVSVLCNPVTGYGVSFVFRHGPAAAESPNFYTQFYYDHRAWGPSQHGNSTPSSSYNWMRLTCDGTTASSKVWPADGITPEPEEYQAHWPVTADAGVAGLVGNGDDGDGEFRVRYVLILAEGLPLVQVGMGSD